MASVTIPESVVAGFTKIATLPEESFQEIISALRNIPLSIRQYRVFDAEGFAPQGIPPEEAKIIADAVFPLYRGLSTSKVALDTYVTDLSRSLRDAKPDGAEWLSSDDDFERFRERLARVLSVDSVKLVAKAHEVLVHHGNTFSTARILSDIRPVFGENVEDSPLAAVIVHMLNVVYYEGDTRKELVVALDTKDIQLLMDALKRAEAKTDSLKKIIASTRMTYIGVA
jgi:hypothetical protein